jgi:hypothetical protein
VTKLTFAPLEKWLTPTPDWNRSDARAWARAKKSGYISEETADRLLIRYTRMQLEIVHPDVQP